MDEINIQHLLFAFDGRINRGKFWLGYGISWGLVIIVGGIVGGIAYAITPTLGYLVFALVYVAVVWIGIAISIKRWHDRDKSGWWIFIAFIPLIGWLWALIETGFLPGTDGDNQYGVDPLPL